MPKTDIYDLALCETNNNLLDVPPADGSLYGLKPSHGTSKNGGRGCCIVSEEGHGGVELKKRSGSFDSTRHDVLKSNGNKSSSNSINDSLSTSLSPLMVLPRRRRHSQESLRLRRRSSIISQSE